MVGCDAEARAGGAGVVEQGLDLAVAGVDAQAAGNTAVDLRMGIEAGVLAQTVEGDVAAAGQDSVKTTLFVGRAVGVGFRAELLVSLPGFVGRRGSGVGDVFAEDGEGLPQGEGLEGEDELYVGLAGNVPDECEVLPQFVFFYEVVGGG